MEQIITGKSNSEFTFLPWVGENYGKGIFNKKIIILGESHYCCAEGTCDECSSLTNTVISEQFTVPITSLPFFTKIAKLFLQKGSGEYISNEEKKTFWDSVLFYNYVQRSVSDKARVAPTGGMWEVSHKPFKILMERYTPDFMLILGNRLWENMPGKAGIDWPDGPINGTWYYVGKTQRTISYKITHPSSSEFTYDMNPLISEIMLLI